MLTTICSKCNFSRADTTKEKIKEFLASPWNEKANNPNASIAVKERAKALFKTTELILNSSPAASIINRNINEVT